MKNTLQNMDSQTVDSQLERIGEHIYNAFLAGQVSFDVCESSLATLNGLCENTWLGMPEVKEF